MNRPLCVWILLGCWLIGSVAQRLYRKLPVFFFTVPGADFLECAEARGVARLPAIVAIKAGRLTIRPFFPFTLLFIPELSGVECDVPIQNVDDVDIVEQWIGKRVTLTVRDNDGGSRTIRLSMAEPEAFMRLLTHRRW